MKNNKGFTLVELLVAIVAFALVSGTVLQLFFISHRLETSAYNQEMATLQATNVIEMAKSSEHPSKIQWDEAFSYPQITDDRLTLFFDQDWFPRNVNGHYVLSATWTQESPGLYLIQIQIDQPEQEAFYQLSVYRYYPQALGGDEQ